MDQSLLCPRAGLVCRSRKARPAAKRTSLLLETGPAIRAGGVADKRKKEAAKYQQIVSVILKLASLEKAFSKRRRMRQNNAPRPLFIRKNVCCVSWDLLVNIILSCLSEEERQSRL